MELRKTCAFLVSPLLCGMVMAACWACSLFEGMVAVDRRADLELARTDLGAAMANGRIYAIGGFSDQTVARVDEYDPHTDSWTRKADMPTARRMFAVAAVDDIIYVTGGMDFGDPNNVTYVYATEIYDPIADAWSSGAALPMSTPFNSVFGNAFVCGLALEGRFYVVVYNTQEPGGSAMYAYDPLGDSWSAKSGPPLLNPWDSYEFAAVECDGRIYVFQGGGLAEYDPSLDSWQTVAEAFHDRYAGGLCALTGRLYAIGGFDDSALVASVEVYSPSTGLWANQGWLGNPRAYFACVALDDEAYLLGGTRSPNRWTPDPLGLVERVAMRD